MGEREELLAAVRARVESVNDAQDLPVVLEPSALTAAHRLAGMMDDDDLPAHYLLGWLHWYRATAQPGDAGRPDLTAAVGMFATCFIAGVAPDDLPDDLVPFIAAQAAAVASRHLPDDAAGPEELTSAIDLWRRIVGTMPADFPRGGPLGILAGALQDRFELTGSLADLDEAVNAGRAAADATGDRQERAGHLHNLSVSLQSRFELSGADADLAEAIRSARAAVADAAAGPERASMLAALANALRLRFERHGVAADLDEAIRAGREALDAIPAWHPDRLTAVNVLAGALTERFSRTGTMPDLDAAIVSVQAAVAATPAGHPDRALYLSNLAGALNTRYQRLGTLADLNAAVDAGRAAAAATPPGHPDRAVTLNNLAGALQARFEHTGATADLDGAVHALEAAVAATSAGQPDILDNLGVVLRLRFHRTGRSEDLDAAIEASRAAVAATPADHPQRAPMLSNLGIALRSRHHHSGDPADLDGAVDAGRAAVAATPADHPQRAGMLSNLGVALLTRYERTDARADLDAAITAGRTAVEVTPADRPDRAFYLSALGAALRHRHLRTGVRADRDEAVSACALATRVTSAPASARIRAAGMAASLLGSGEPGRAADLLETAVRLLPQVVPRELERADQQYTIGGFAGLAADAAALALAARDTAAGRALSLLEMGRAVLLGQALDTRGDSGELRRRHPALAARFAELRDLLDVFPASHEATWRQPVDRHALAAEFATVLARIRALDGFADFALAPAAEDLVAQAAAGPVAVFNVSPHRSDALLVTADGISHVELPGLDHATVVRRVGEFHRALAATTDPDADRLAAQAKLRDVLGWLWDEAAGPVLGALGHHDTPPADGTWPRVWWAPGGLLGQLPVHAAGHHTDPPGGAARRTVLDRVVSSYTPTVRALGQARRNPARRSAAPKALIVAMSTTPGLPDEGRLDYVRAEAALVRTRLPASVLLAEPAAEAGRAVPTKATVLAQLPGCTVAHFACHGESHPTDPSRSRLLLRDHAEEPLTVASLASLRLDHAQLAYLSACRTAFTGAARLLDEAIHLSSACQLAGFPHVVGSLWEIDDDVAVRVAEAFYAGIVAEDGSVDAGSAACALHHAVRSIRDRFPGTPSLWAGYLHSGA
ncbi:CHAT domain-containing protein [Acrocarpospora phusangensis]|uniref:CHAT domain-containing protein n=1 Tax=Acrocarpospora phusangensis TaxID=1070424 RepID=A0A919UJ60_9ACTN|nr:CHAT domain-containing protein [Acrocarpospora phusangensis]GIH23461.1 CHAT domain-containing protein [Acrocarpospora phusangensis]